MRVVERGDMKFARVVRRLERFLQSQGIKTAVDVYEVVTCAQLTRTLRPNVWSRRRERYCDRLALLWLVDGRTVAGANAKDEGH